MVSRQIHKRYNHRVYGIAATLAALNDAVQGAGRSTARHRRIGETATDELTRSVACEARDAVDALCVAEIDRMLATPWRIAAAVYPWLRPTWPVVGKRSDDVLADCRRFIHRERDRAGHWTYDMNRMIALRQAEAALARMTDVSC